eukprot:TRINITY_DN6767_c0_g2_i1.p1 TRINITY_DN6767_c0_g2~~TRINITY_DN6767_c0_g2_i1.p1  ORF type:complete len:558 (+),score=74.07 TRINITY_DN6767_c0_g2_i1:1-1674(+)
MLKDIVLLEFAQQRGSFIKLQELTQGLSVPEAHSKEKAKRAKEMMDEHSRNISPSLRKFRTLASSSPATHFFSNEENINLMYHMAGITPLEDVLKKPNDARIIQDVEEPERKKLLMQGSSISTVNVPELVAHLLKEGKLSHEFAMNLLGTATKVLSKEPTLLELTDMPVTIVGDIHGQFYDLMNLMKHAGDPKNGTRYLFLGDYVDRGSFSCEVVFYLCSIKINYPERVWLLRGNHESIGMTNFFNFKEEVLFKYNETVYDAFTKLFDSLPLAATVQGKHTGKYLCLHGGIGPSLNSLDDIRKIDRFGEVPDAGAFCDILWADPFTDQYTVNDESLLKSVEFLPNDIRGCSYVYGYKAVKDFLKRNNLSAIIRAHEAQQEGYQEHFFLPEKERKKDPLVITVFSAPNYCDMYSNKAAYCIFNDQGYAFKQFSWVEHPAYLPDFMNGFTYSFPFLAEEVMKICGGFLKGTIESCYDSEELPSSYIADVKHLRRLSMRLKKSEQEMKHCRKDNECISLVQIFNESVSFDKAMAKFASALEIDRRNEKRPQVSTRSFKTL